MKLKSNWSDNIKLMVLLICFVLSPLLTMPFSVILFLREKNSGRRVAYAALFAGAMAFVAFHTVPLESDDLHRHLWSMSVLRVIPFRQIFSASYPGVYLNTLIMYLLSKTGVFGLYPALFIGVGYFLILRNMTRLGLHKHSFLEAALILLFVFFAVNCRDFVSGLRNYFSFIVCGYLLVNKQYFSMNKWLCYVGIFAIGFIHTSAFIVLCVVLVSDIIKGKKLKWLALVAMCLFVPAAIIGCKVLLMIPGLESSTFINKIYAYVTTPNIINYRVYLFELGILVLAVICHLINKRFMTEDYAKISNFFDYFLVLTVAVTPIMLLLTRFLFLLIPLMPIMQMRTYEVIKKHKLLKWGFSVTLVLFIGAGMLMFLASIRAYPWNFGINNIFFPFL